MGGSAAARALPRVLTGPDRTRRRARRFRMLGAYLPRGRWLGLMRFAMPRVQRQAGGDLAAHRGLVHAMRGLYLACGKP